MIFAALTVLGAVISFFSPALLGELNWLLWVAPLLVFLLFFLLGVLWAPWIMHQERKTGVSKEIEPPKVIVSTRMEGTVQAEEDKESTRVKEPPLVEKKVEATKVQEARTIERPVQVQKEIQTKREEPFRVDKFSSPLLREMEAHFEELGEAVAYPRLSEKEEYLTWGFRIAYKPGTHQEVWITHGSVDHIMMLKPE